MTTRTKSDDDMLAQLDSLGVRLQSRHRVLVESRGRSFEHRRQCRLHERIRSNNNLCQLLDPAQHTSFPQTPPACRTWSTTQGNRNST